jgi:hypothetical protein
MTDDEQRRDEQPADQPPVDQPPEAGLVVEDDEIDLGDDESPDPEPEETAAPAPEPEPADEPEPAAEREPYVIPAHAISDDWHGDEPPVAAGPGSADKKPRRWGRHLLLAVVVLVGGAYVAGYFLTGSRMPAT